MQSDEEIQALRDATREAHEVLKDLRHATRDAKAVFQIIEGAAQTAVDERVKPVVQSGLEAFAEELRKAVDDATERVFKRFDTIADYLLGEDKRSKRRGKPSIEDVAHIVKDRE